MRILLVIFGLIAYLVWRMAKALISPIFSFAYESLIKAIMGTGMSEAAAKATISLVAFAIIAALLFL